MPVPQPKKEKRNWDKVVDEELKEDGPEGTKDAVSASSVLFQGGLSSKSYSRMCCMNWQYGSGALSQICLAAIGRPLAESPLARDRSSYQMIISRLIQTLILKFGAVLITERRRRRRSQRIFQPDLQGRRRRYSQSDDQELY